MTQPAAMIGHHTWLMADPQAPPEYKVYRTRPRLPRRGGDDGSLLDELRGAPPKERRRKPISVGRVVKWLALALVAWIGLSLVLFLISAQVNQDQVSAAAQAQLSDGGVGILKPQTTLILGSDRRTAGTKEPGASTSGPSRSDSILLVRTGGGHSAKLSIPRDTVVDIPGHGRNKINAAYAIGGAALTAQTVKQYLGISIDHVFEVSFDNFPALVDAMGGINYTGGCVVSKINGGFKNGGFTLRLQRGTTHINGKQALALARTRHNACNPKENDLTRARRQQKVISAMKSRVFSPSGFVRLPFISWNAPKTLKTDMRGPALLGYAIGTAISGGAQTEILKPSGGVTLPDGGAGLTVSDAEKQADVRRFLDG
jgi:LCP family protein required for cell wall assembly